VTETQPAFQGLIGVARRDITPPVGIYARNWGAATHDVAAGIHRPLTATALSLQPGPGESPLILFALDLGWWRTVEDEWRLRRGIIESLGLPVENVVVNLSHTHSGPALCLEDSDKPGGAFIAPYLQEVASAVVEAAREALANRTAATLDWTFGHCALARHRDLPAGARFLCGFNPEGLPDQTLLAGRVSDPQGRLLATVANYACHPTTLAWQNQLISPDYVGAMREVVETHTAAPCLFLQGASGELAPREQYTGDTAIADANGRQLGFAVLAALESMLPAAAALEFGGVAESGAPLAVWHRTAADPPREMSACVIEVELPLKNNLRSLATIESELRNCTNHVMSERLRRELRVRRTVGDSQTSKLGCWLWRLGDALLVGTPAEPYAGLQKELRRAFAPRPVVVMNVTNGHRGYLPPADLYAQNLYQVWQTPFARGSLENLTAAVRNRLAAM
jgi:hypothetical protein